MKRTHRKTLAQETVTIVRHGQYTAPSGQLVNIGPEVETAKGSTGLYDASSLRRLGAPAESTNDASLEVTNESTYAAIQRLHDEGAAYIGCLNFASAKNPGGGFLNGSEAQEEALARASALYDCLLCASDYYERNRVNESCLYLDLLIASREVPFFRDDEGALLESPVLATVITAPAPNAGAVERNEPGRMSEVVTTLRRRAELVLRAAVAEGVTALVLGAWGCGVFRNDPAEVAQAFAELLQPGCLYATAFERVVFAIFDPAGAGANLSAFRSVFTLERESHPQSSSQSKLLMPFEQMYSPLRDAAAAAGLDFREDEEP